MGSATVPVAPPGVSPSGLPCDGESGRGGCAGRTAGRPRRSRSPKAVALDGWSGFVPASSLLLPRRKHRPIVGAERGGGQAVLVPQIYRRVIGPAIFSRGLGNVLLRRAEALTRDPVVPSRRMAQALMGITTVPVMGTRPSRSLRRASRPVVFVATEAKEAAA